MGASILFPLKKNNNNLAADPPTKNPQNHSFNRVLASGDLKNETGRVFYVGCTIYRLKSCPESPKTFIFDFFLDFLAGRAQNFRVFGSHRLFPSTFRHSGG